MEKTIASSYLYLQPEQKSSRFICEVQINAGVRWRVEVGSSSLMSTNISSEAEMDGGSTVTELCSVLLFGLEALMENILIAAELVRARLW